MQEDDIAADFCDIDIQIAYARKLTFQHRQFMIMCREQSPDMGVIIAEILTGSPGNRQTIIGAGAAPDLIQNDQTARPGVVENIGQLAHLHKEGGLPLCQIVRGADARKDAVTHPDMRLRAWHEAACHIRSCDQKQARVTIIQISVVGHKQTVTDHLLNDRMSALDDLQFHRSIHNRLHIAKLFTDLREGRQNIQLRDRRGGLLNGFHIALDFLSHTDKKLVFQLIDLGLRIQN